VEAVDEWKSKFLDYVNSCPGDTIWWYEIPTIESCLIGDDLHFRVYGRLAIGNAP
jgi:hypothetical protein